MLNEEERKYLSCPRLSLKINYVKFGDNFDNNDIFYYHGNGIIISTINSETYIDKKIYNGETLNTLLNNIFSCIDTTELILPIELLSVEIISKTFANLNCSVLTIEENIKITKEQLVAINTNCNIKELKVSEFDKLSNEYKLNFKIFPNLKKRFTSKKFDNLIIDDIFNFKYFNIELPLVDDFETEDKKNISEKKDLQLIIDSLIDIDSLTFTILDNGKDSIIQSEEIIEQIEKSINSKIENIYYITGNRNIENIEVLKNIEKTHKLSIMYDKDIICSISDFLNMRKHINKIIESVKKFELSPLEKTLYLYDYLKDFYNVNSKYIKDKKASKYIHRIFIANELNSQSYAALYAEILRELKIQATDYYLYTPLSQEVFLTKDNHARTMIYLIDKKYKINGLFSCDVVWDAIKKSKQKYHYEFFLNRIANLKKQYSTDVFRNDIELLLGNKSINDLSNKEVQVFEKLLNKNSINASDIVNLREIMKCNISLKIFLYALSAVRVAQGRDKKSIKLELVAIVNRTNKNEQYTNKFYNANEDLKYLDITIPD